MQTTQLMGTARQNRGYGPIFLHNCGGSQVVLGKDVYVINDSESDVSPLTELSGTQSVADGAQVRSVQLLSSRSELCSTITAGHFI